MNFKKSIIAVALATISMTSFAEEVKSPHIVDYSWGVVSANVRADMDNMAGASYAELEGGFGKGNFDFYGFFDLMDDGSTFSKAQGSYTLGSGVYLEATNKRFGDGNGFEASDTFAGIGYKYTLESGFIKGSYSQHLSGGEAFMTAWSMDTGLYGTRFDGWHDWIKKDDGEMDSQGNWGVRKVLSDSFYIRGAAQYNNGDYAPHLQIGYMI